ncbi:MAG TPA: NPCBM/NEW2 domain-containing protein, partial [Verrucomicrobiae bacterium]|nr:NPCBM/NEW2 domain-containing protein [Verrucomicrobiae bacterium]
LFSLRLLLSVFLLVLGSTSFGQQIGLKVNSETVRLKQGAQTWIFCQNAGRWSFKGIEVRGKLVVQPLSVRDSFCVGGGEAAKFSIISNAADEKAIRFHLEQGDVVYRIRSDDKVPGVHVQFERTNETVCAFCSSQASRDEHGAWMTRGWVATDLDGSEAFIDASNPLVFGHSTVDKLDIDYLFVPKVNGHIQRNGRTEQRSGTFFKAERVVQVSGARARWQLRLGQTEPKAFLAVFDRDLGGRVSDVCEKYFAPAVDAMVNLTNVPVSEFDPEKCMQIMPVRLAAPDAFIPGWGLTMDEFPNASYPFAHDAVWQTPAVLAFEGLATGRPWEKNFARYCLDNTPLEGADGKSFFVRRPGGLARWGYFATYRDGFVPLDGGTWWQADILYRTALALKDEKLRHAAVDMVRHDLKVKLNLERMTYPPCWDGKLDRPSGDHRDDWFMTPGLAYCAYMAARVAYPETKDPEFLRVADRICDWFASYIVPEKKLNDLQGNNMHAVFSHYLTLAFLDKFDRSHDQRFLDMARDMAWVHIMTTCATDAKDNHGRPLTGTTCVGVRGCVDYDCAPNLCHEKDLTFVHIIGPLLDHVSGPAYAKYIALCRLVLDKDSWKSAWAMELRDTNLRTMYDTYARGMANLIYALNRSNDPWVNAVEKLVSKSDVGITRNRDFLLANGTGLPRDCRVEVRFLEPGQYRVSTDGGPWQERSSKELAAGLELKLESNSMRTVRVQPKQIQLASQPAPNRYEPATNWLSDLEPFASQRGTGLPQPVYRKDLSFSGAAITVSGQTFRKGLGCAANTVLLYRLHGNVERFKAVVGIDDSVIGRTNPPPSVDFTVFVDGKLQFESGPMFATTPRKEVDVSLNGAEVLMLRLSCNWDDNGNSINDYADWADARLVGIASGFNR